MPGKTAPRDRVVKYSGGAGHVSHVLRYCIIPM